MRDILFTFGIITYADGGVSDLLKASVESIRSLRIPEYEIVIVGKQSVLDKHPDFQHNDVRLIDFDESKRDKWITRKKNLVTDSARLENVVYQHDYIVYDKNWYEGFKQHGNNFDICLNKVTNPKANRENDRPEDFVKTASGGEENRFRDLTLDMWLVGSKLRALGIDKRACVIPYDTYTSRLSRYMYINGTYWVAKRSFMKKCRLNESLSWGQGEDVEFSRRASKLAEFHFNPHSIVKLNKPGARVFSIMTKEEIRRFRMSVGII